MVIYNIDLNVTPPVCRVGDTVRIAGWVEMVCPFHGKPIVKIYAVKDSDRRVITVAEADKNGVFTATWRVPEWAKGRIFIGADTMICGRYYAVSRLVPVTVVEREEQEGEVPTKPTQPNYFAVAAVAATIAALVALAYKLTK